MPEISRMSETGVKIEAWCRQQYNCSVKQQNAWYTGYNIYRLGGKYAV